MSWCHKQIFLSSHSREDQSVYQTDWSTFMLKLFNSMIEEVPREFHSSNLHKQHIPSRAKFFCRSSSMPRLLSSQQRWVCGSGFVYSGALNGIGQFRVYEWEFRGAKNNQNEITVLGRTSPRFLMKYSQVRCEMDFFEIVLHISMKHFKFTLSPSYMEYDLWSRWFSFNS